MKSRNCKSLYVVIAAVLLMSGALYSQQKRSTQSAHVRITRMGYEPATLRLRRGVPARITFLRTTDETCATEVIFPDYGIKRELPLNQPATIRLTPTRAGEFSFTCGMKMQRGNLIVQ